MTYDTQCVAATRNVRPAQASAGRKQTRKNLSSRTRTGTGTHRVLGEKVPAVRLKRAVARASD